MSATQPNPPPQPSEQPSASASQPRRRSRHVHHWRMTTHLDFCHYYTSVYACTGCSATASKTVDRDPNSFSPFMFEENYVEIRRDEKGRFVTPRWEVRVCARCEAIKAGGPRYADLVIVGKDGEIEREEHTPIPPES